jgi:antitoxin (DNA-binding transcriptional repressor) of toxin-antitoxin stability system
MKEFGIRQAKTQLPQLVRNAAKGERILVTDNRNPVAMIGPLSTAVNAPEPAVAGDLHLSRAAAFRKALFGAPYPFELDF